MTPFEELIVDEIRAVRIALWGTDYQYSENMKRFLAPKEEVPSDERTAGQPAEQPADAEQPAKRSRQ